MKETKIIRDVLVTRSTTWPNYGCSVDGRVFRWDYEKEMSVGMLRGEHSKNYPCVRVSHNCKASWANVHVMLAECYLENDDPINKVDVNHINGNKKDYRLENLEWCTKSQNQRHALDSSLKQKGEELYNSQLSNDQVHIICQELQSGALVNDLAKKFDVSKDIVRKIKDGSTYFHIRTLYPINHSYRQDFSESTVRWVCEQIVKGFSDKKISEMSENKKLVTIEVKRVRNKIRYRHISDEYF